MKPSEIVAMIKQVRADAGAPWFRGPWNLNITGIRRPWGPDRKVSDLFDDAIVFATEDDDGRPVALLCRATTDPGRPYMIRPLRSEGCAIVAPGHYRGAYTLGHHKGWPAFEQVGPIQVFRDSSRDAVFDAGPRIPAGPECKINIHAAADDTTGPASLVVGRWSAGCQVLRRRSDLRKSLDLGLAQRRAGRGDRFSYLLIEGQSLEAEALYRSASAG